MPTSPACGSRRLGIRRQPVLRGFGDGACGGREPEKSLLSELVEKFNERFGTSLTEQDIFKPLEEAMKEPKVQLAAVANVDEENFGHVFYEVFEDKMMEHLDTNGGPRQQNTSSRTRVSAAPSTLVRLAAAFRSCAVIFPRVSSRGE
ncbi:hypothetical protein [Sphaerisporangium dianthi]|uniref:Uncharacterized protein n=1 Tax=Sphaerisporangium dianthi TaxID=1436120 RepID=A0ABV9CQV5_9ACTN